MTNAMALNYNVNKLNMVELYLDELCHVLGGESAENGAIEWVLDKATGAICTLLKDLIGTCIPATFEEFYNKYTSNKKIWDAATGTVITAMCGPVGAGAYAFCDKKRFWKRIYDKLQ